MHGKVNPFYWQSGNRILVIRDKAIVDLSLVLPATILLQQCDALKFHVLFHSRRPDRRTKRIKARSSLEELAKRPLPATNRNWAPVSGSQGGSRFVRVRLRAAFGTLRHARSRLQLQHPAPPYSPMWGSLPLPVQLQLSAAISRHCHWNVCTILLN